MKRLKAAGLIALAVMLVAPTEAHGARSDRVYEMVSPLYKAGYGATGLEAVSQNGESVAYFSPGAFAGAQSGLLFLNELDYVARREASGWETVPLMPPASLSSTTPRRDVSPDLLWVLSTALLGTSSQQAELGSTEGEFLLHDTQLPDVEMYWKVVGQSVLETTSKGPIAIGYEGASVDLCHILLKNGGGALISAAEKTRDPLYEMTGSCPEEPAELKLVGVDNEGNPLNPSCPVQLGIEDYSVGSYGPSTRYDTFNAISQDGSEIFFSDCIKEELAHHQLFVRLNGEKTIEVSKSLEEACGEEEVPCNSATERLNSDFVGASRDGSRVYFTTKSSLTGEANDSSNNLYGATIGCREAESDCSVADEVVTGLTRISRDPSPEANAEVLGVIRVAPDGSHVYFVAKGDLLASSGQSRLEAEGRPVPYVGADNLYVYDASNDHIAFVADLCSGVQLSGSVEDIRCPSVTGTDGDLWESSVGISEAQTGGPSGRFFVFASYGQLTRTDTDSARDIYRYDAVTGVLTRVSIGENGYHANGNDDTADATLVPGRLTNTKVLQQYAMDKRAISEDGARIVFKSAEPLSANATNGLTNVYEWHEEEGLSEGKVSLLTGGNGETAIENVVIDASGRNVFFVTTQGLVPQDIDGASDIYDARLEGGFPYEPAERQPCEGDACQGPLTNPAPLLIPGSALQAPDDSSTSGNATSSSVRSARKPPAKPNRHKRKSKRHRHRSVKPAKKG